MNLICSHFFVNCVEIFCNVIRNEEDDDLLMQIDVFEDQRLNDEDEFGGINLNNHNDVFQALFQKVKKS